MLHLGLSGWLLNYTGVCVYREKEEEDISFEKEKKRREQKRLLAAAAAAPKSNMLPGSSAGFICILILASFSIAVIQTRIKIRVSALLFSSLLSGGGGAR